MAGICTPQIVAGQMPHPDFTGPLWARLADLLHRAFAFFYERPFWLRLAFALCLLSFLVTGLRIARSEPKTNVLPFLVSSRSDFDDYFQASRAFARGDEDPYHTQNLKEAARLFQESKNDPAKLILAIAQLRGVGSYLYPPFTAFLLTPFTGMSYSKAALVFQVLSFSALFFFVYILYYSFLSFFPDLLSLQGRDRDKGLVPQAALLPIFGATILLFGFLSGNAANGNMAFFLIFLCGLGLMLGFHKYPFYSLFGGFLLGLASVMKVTPLFLVLLFVAGRRPLAVLGFLIGLFFALFVPGLYYGVTQNWRYLSDWYSLIIESYNKITFIRSWMNNQSLAGAIGRFFLSGQEVRQSVYGLPWNILPELRGAERVAFFGAIVKVLSFLLYVLAGLSALLLALRGGFRGWIRSFFLFQKDLDASEGFFWQKALLDPAMLRLHLLVVLASLVASGVSWYHAYSFLFFVLVLYLYKFLLDKFYLLSSSLFPGDGASEPSQRISESKEGMSFGEITRLQIHTVEVFLCVVIFFFGFLFPFFPKGLREFLSVFSVFTVALYVLALALGFFLIKELLEDVWSSDRSGAKAEGGAGGF